MNIVNERELEVLRQFNPLFLLFVVCFCISGLLLLHSLLFCTEFHLSLAQASAFL